MQYFLFVCPSDIIAISDCSVVFNIMNHEYWNKRYNLFAFFRILEQKNNIMNLNFTIVICLCLHIEYWNNTSGTDENDLDS